MLLACPEDAYRYIGKTLLAALSEPAVDTALEGRPVRLRLGLIDPDCVLYVDTERHEVRAYRGDTVESGMAAMSGDTAVRYCQGRVDVATAMAVGDIAVDGDSQRFLDALIGTASLPASFADVVRREGRGDLLADVVGVRLP